LNNLDQHPLGIWLIGGRGAVATTTIVGALALRRRLIEPLGLCTAHPPLSSLALAPIDSLRFGGHDLSPTPLVEAARRLRRDAGPLAAELVSAVEGDLPAVEAALRPVPSLGDGARAFVATVRHDVEEFRRATGARRVIVVNVATTEPPMPPQLQRAGLTDLEAFLDEPGGATALPQSILYAYAALGAGHPYVNFTPSPGADLPALEELARTRVVPHAGRDGKTGETLLKSTLAPLFALRQLRVRSWTGFNVLGNEDGRALAEPDIAASKIESKSALLPAILGYTPHSLVRIDYVPPLGDWKTAWDLVQFDGFLGTPMTLQLTWQGSDSALAAPLVLDLVRLVDHSASRGEGGALGHLAFFFKKPIGCDVHELTLQHQLLVRHLCG
jgi:myo-inositol-1-phosphate synthase